MNDKLKARLTSRKFWAAMFWEGVMTALLWFGKLPVETYVTLTYLLLGGYLVANVTQGVLKPKADAEALKTQAEALNTMRRGNP